MYGRWAISRTAVHMRTEQEKIPVAVSATLPNSFVLTRQLLDSINWHWTAEDLIKYGREVYGERQCDSWDDWAYQFLFCLCTPTTFVGRRWCGGWQQAWHLNARILSSPIYPCHRSIWCEYPSICQKNWLQLMIHIWICAGARIFRSNQWGCPMTYLQVIFQVIVNSMILRNLGCRVQVIYFARHLSAPLILFW